MYVEVKVVGSATQTVDEAFPTPADTTLRSLLGDLVAAEVAGYESRRDERRLLHVLTDRQLAAGVEAGRITSGGQPMRHSPSVAEALEHAVEAFRDGLFLAVLDGRQLEELDAPLSVEPDSRLRLVRLVALAGG